MLKRLTAILLLACAVLTLLAACNSKKALTSEAAQQIALNDLGVTEEQVSDIHVHITTNDGAACYSIYVTVNGVQMEYLIHGTTGEILSSGEGSHSH